jgi:hypothetical protein
MTYRLTVAQFIMGSLFVAMGLFVIVLVASGSMAQRDGSEWLVALFGAVFVLVGLGILEVHRLLGRRLHSLNIDWNGLWPGLLVSSVGIFLIVMSFVDEDENFNAPRWVITMAGAVFLFAGLLVLKNLVIDKGQMRTNDVFTGLVGGLLVTCFAGVALGIVLDPEEQVDSMSQFIFAPGALILSTLTVVTWYNVFKQLKHTLWPRIQASQATQRAGVLIVVLALLAIFVVLFAILPGRSPVVDGSPPTVTRPF